jgi:integrase
VQLPQKQKGMINMKKKISKVLTYKRGNLWAYRFESAPVDGKRKWITKSGFKNQSEAYEAGMAAYTQYKQTGKSFTPSNISVSDYMDYWIDNYCKVNLKANTASTYKKKIDLYIKPAIGSYYLKDIEPSLLQELINNLFNTGMSRNSLGNVKGILTKSFAYAKTTARFINDDPSATISLPLPRAKAEVKTKKKVRVVWTDEQLDTVFKTFAQGHIYHMPLLLAYRCGMRLGEIFGLMWNDIDFAKGILSVNRQVQNHNDKWYLENPKYDSFRTIELDDITISELKRLYEHEKECEQYYNEYYNYIYCETLEDDSKRLTYEPAGESIHMVLVRDDGSWIQPRTMMHCFNVIHHKLGFTELDFHSLRHTHASNLLAKGADVKYVQERLGHKNVATTLDIYAHVTETMRERNKDILNTL